MLKTILGLIKAKGTFNKIIIAGEYAKLIADTFKFYKEQEVARGLSKEETPAIEVTK